MPAPSWFHKLRRKRRKQGGKQRSAACPSPTHGEAVAVVTTSVTWTDERRTQPPAAPCTPNRASYYFPTADREKGALRCIAPRGGDDEDDGTAVLDVRVDVVHRRAGRLGGIDAPPATPELNLPRIVTRPGAAKNDGTFSSSASTTTTSAATTPPSATCRARGFHMKPASRRRRRGHRDENCGGPQKEKDKVADAAATGPHPHVGARRRRRWLYESLVVVKTSSDPEQEMAESMAEMVAANRIRSSEDLEELLACYLALNAAEHHRAVLAAFRRVWLHIARQRLLHLRH